MKAIIGGKRYNTETAIEVASRDNGLSYTDFRQLSESLYRTPRGSWFLAGSGGPLTPYAVSVGDMRTGGSAIRPLTAEEARSWLESYDKHDALEEYFSDHIEDA